jgi:hypothetical protein
MLVSHAFLLWCSAYWLKLRLKAASGCLTSSAYASCHVLCTDSDGFVADLCRIMQLLDEAPIQSGPLIDGAFCLLRFIPASLLHELLAHATSKTVPTTPVDTPPPSAPNSSNALLSTPGGTLSARGIAVDAQYSVNTEINAHAGGNSGFHGMTRAVASVSISSGTTDSPGGPVLKLDSRSVESSLESVFSHALSTSRSIESLVGPHLDAHAGHSHPGSACGTPSDTTSATSRADAALSDSSPDAVC